jgi:hypothetical protein
MLTRRSMFFAPAALAAAPVAAAPVSGTKVLVVAGQSLATGWNSQIGVKDAYREAAPGWEPVVLGKAGTWARYNPVSRYDWWVNTNNTNGPVLKEVVAALRQMGRVDAILWSQGQADGGGYTGKDPERDARYAAMYQRTVLLILERMRRASAGGRWREIPVFVQIIGWRMDRATKQLFEPHGYSVIRTAQLQMVEGDIAKEHNLHLGPVQEPWMQLKADGVHPTTENFCVLARRQAAAQRRIGI